MKFDLPNRAGAQFARRNDPNTPTRTSRSKTGPRAAVTALAVTLLCGGLAVANDDADRDDDRGGGRGNATQLRKFIDRQVGGIQKLMVPADDASIPLPRQADGSVNPRFKTTEEKRFLGKMLFHDPVRTARVNINQIGRASCRERV